MQTLAQTWAATTNRKVRWNSLTVYSLARFEVSNGDIIKLQRIRSSTRRAQALKIGVDRGDLRANGLLAQTIGVWSHTAPEHTTIEVVGRRAKTIEVWNAWSVRGVDTSWIGNSGMIIESKGRSHRFRCSDGLGAASFDDLIVELTL